MTEPYRQTEATHWRTFAATTLVTWLLLLAFSFLRTPIPDVNEAHYLAKSRHFWQPQWCQGDQFLESSNPHAVFYWTWGWLAHVLPFHQAAVIGRAAALAVVAAGWTLWMRSLFRQQPVEKGVRPFRADMNCPGKSDVGEGQTPFSTGCWACQGVLTLVIFLACQHVGNWSGEWLVGGVESKVVAYGLVFAAWGCLPLTDIRYATSGLCSAALLGSAISFHPVVGGWCLILTLGSAIPPWRYSNERTADVEPLPLGLNSWLKWLACVLILMLCAAPGLWYALGSLSGAADAATRTKADLLLVGSRLAHHLDPLRFNAANHWYYAGLTAAAFAGMFLTSRQLFPANSRLRWLNRIWGTSYGIATLALIIATSGVKRPFADLPDHIWRVSILKFYCFRLFDLLTPIVVAVQQVAIWSSYRNTSASVVSVSRPSTAVRIFKLQRGLAILLSLGLIIGLTLHLKNRPVAKHSSSLSHAQRADWIAACNWIKTSTSKSARVQCLNENWACKWFAERSEYVSYKDCPQDATNIVEWNRRLWTIYQWKLLAFKDGSVSTDELRELRDKTGITHILVGRFKSIAATPVHFNKTFRIYELPV